MFDGDDDDEETRVDVSEIRDILGIIDGVVDLTRARAPTTALTIGVLVNEDDDDAGDGAGADLIDREAEDAEDAWNDANPASLGPSTGAAAAEDVDAVVDSLSRACRGRPDRAAATGRAIITVARPAALPAKAAIAPAEDVIEAAIFSLSRLSSLSKSSQAENCTQREMLLSENCAC